MISRKIKVDRINGFVDNEKGGNPAGVVFNADSLSQDEKQKIAAKVAFAETAFISKSTIAEYKFDFFTPSKQIAHCGHATIAAFSYLEQQGKLGTQSSKETIDGIRKIIIKDGKVFMEQVAPRYLSVKEDIPGILQSLNLQSGDLLEKSQPMVINTGNSFLLVGVKNIETLKSLVTDVNAIFRISEKYQLIGFYVYATETIVAGRDASARMFGPYYGIPEESATGMAAGPLAAYLHDKLGIKKNSFLIEQGWFMQTRSPSLIHVELNLNNGEIFSLMAGGKGKFMGSVEVEI